MARNNIFEIINSKQSPLSEITRIETLLTQKEGVFVTDEVFVALMGKGNPESIIDYIDGHLFKNWMQRGNCITCKDFKESIGIVIPDSDDNLSNEDILSYCEYAANLIFLVQIGLESGDTLSDAVGAAEKNIKTFLGWYNYETREFVDKEQVLVVCKDAKATVAAEITDEKIAYSILDYNHYLLKGDLQKKKDILLALGSDIEPQRPLIHAIDKDLEDSIFFMLNNLNLRHNNRKKNDKNYKEYVAKMQKVKLEEWYDELYQLILSAYILLDNVNRKQKVKELKMLIAKENQ